MQSAGTSPPSAEIADIRQLIGGNWVASVDTYDVDPYRGGLRVRALKISTRRYHERQDSESRFGFQFGLFKKSLDLAMRAVRSILTGGVILDDPSTWRTDQLAYGRIKDSGIGGRDLSTRSRVMTDEHLVVFNL